MNASACITFLRSAMESAHPTRSAGQSVNNTRDRTCGNRTCGKEKVSQYCKDQDKRAAEGSGIKSKLPSVDWTLLLSQDLRDTIEAYKARDPAARSAIEILLLYPGVSAIRSYRKAHWCHEHNLKFPGRWISQRSRRRTGIEIHPAAKIGKRLVIDHGMGIVIGETAEIGDDCLIYHGVTLGGTGKDTGKRHPTIGNNVLIGTGAKVLGPFKVGDNSRIAANSVVLSEVPPDSTAVGIPARIVWRKGVRQNYVSEVDQVNVSDPIATELNSIKEQLQAINIHLNQL